MQADAQFERLVRHVFNAERLHGAEDVERHRRDLAGVGVTVPDRQAAHLDEQNAPELGLSYCSGV